MANSVPYMTVAETAAYLRRHPKTVLRMLRAGALEGYQPAAGCKWLISRAAADRWLRGEPPPTRRLRRAS
jgi:excisionase family DNA binding protein